MTSLASDLIALLGKSPTDPDVRRAIAAYDLVDVDDDPPSRRYVGSEKKGVDVLFESDRVIDIQFYVRPTKPYSAFSEPLPFGIRAGMTQNQVHHLLGEPNSYDKFDSKYFMRNGEKAIQVTVVYNTAMVVEYLSVGLPYQKLGLK